MRVAIVGAGAVGGVVAWHMAQAGQKPVIIARPQTAALLSAEGLTLQAPSVAAQTLAVQATADAASAGIQDLVIVGFKAQDWEGGLDLVRPLVGPSTIVLPMLNGIPWWYLDGLGPQFGDRTLQAVDANGAIDAAISAGQILGCVVYIGANRPAPNVVTWNGRKRLIIGEPLAAQGGRLAEVVAFLKAGGIDAEQSDDIRLEVWLKLLGNAAYNPISAVTGAAIDKIADDPATRAVAKAIMAECVAVAGALGVAGLPDLEVRLQVPPTLIGVKTSMLQDMEAGRPLELGAIVAAVAELGRRTGVPTPTIECVGALAASAWRQRWGG
ncbi:2-dehydropantoate 2-reductase [Bosea caraganae]|uniref:2-dehydropantoate 2-reductase n=1 Tax=Bosea caraganae TaxID=2763117 RepID=A0A370L9G4_9HYPH|nr:2-dehydropantoate 2-reductase [Bosea caraganae]RDJ26917.1 2-dehydropantoate 2-reductase [Bosea caraganae]RDJ30804.1 2-dehydropantoate 2-reductase [Bosea caraganae]